MENIIEKNNLKILGQLTPEFDEILTNDALLFVEKLEKKFGERRRELLKKREDRQSEIDNGILPDFLSSNFQVLVFI